MKSKTSQRLNAIVDHGNEAKDWLASGADFVAVAKDGATLIVVKHRFGLEGTYKRVGDTTQHVAPPIPMLLWCPECGERHVDEGEFATKEHHTHACQSCGHCWRPAIVNTVGVRFLPGFKNEDL